MKYLWGAVLVSALLLAGCEQAVNSTNEVFGKAQALTVTSTTSSGTSYWDLDTKTEVTGDDIATGRWDIAFKYSTGGVYTNSGATATSLSSGGLGGVVYTGKTEFDAVNSTSGDFTAEYATDVTKTVTTQGQSTTTADAVLNVMTKLDYVSGSGTTASPFVNDSTTGVYDGDAYYTYSGSAISASGEVYLIRHGDGTSFSKLQITSVTLSADYSTRTRVIKFAND